MKLIEPLALCMAVGCILAAGCVAPTNRDPANATTAANFAPFSNTSGPGLNKTINVTNSTPELKGSLRVSISGISYPVNASVILDNATAGTVNPASPLYLMVTEGNHRIMVCVDQVCEQEHISARFGSYVTIDFSERLQKAVKFPNPTARPTVQILDFYKNGNVVSVYVEFINPESADHTMSVDLSIGYTYMDDRSNIKLGDSTQGKTSVLVKAGHKETKRVDLYLASDSVMSFDNPEIQGFSVK